MQYMSDESQSQTSPQPVQQIVEQTIKLPGLSKKIARSAMRISIKALWRERRKPLSAEERKKVIEDLRKAGVTDEYLPFVLLIIDSTGKGLRDHEEAHRLDRYLVGGCAIFDLVLLQILSSNLAGTAAHVSLIALAIALSCTAGSLSFSFFRKNPKRYGKPHSTFSMLAILGTIISATALFWHFWMPAGITFLIASCVVALVSVGYAAFVVLRKHIFPEPIEQEIIYD